MDLTNDYFKKGWADTYKIDKWKKENMKFPHDVEILNDFLKKQILEYLEEQVK